MLSILVYTCDTSSVFSNSLQESSLQQESNSSPIPLTALSSVASSFSGAPVCFQPGLPVAEEVQYVWIQSPGPLMTVCYVTTCQEHITHSDNHSPTSSLLGSPVSSQPEAEEVAIHY